MALCFLNLSIGIYANAPSLLKIDREKKLDGIFGKLYDQFFVYKNRRDCVFIPYYNDDKRSNKSYQYMLNNDLIDMISGSFYLKEEIENMEKSKIVASEPFRVGQLIKYEKFKKLQNSDFISFLFENMHILLIILFSYLFVILTCLSFFNFSSPNYRIVSKKSFLVFDLFFIDLNKLMLLSLKIYLLFLLFVIFNKIFGNLISNYIQVEKVVVDRNALIDSVKKLTTTEKTMVFFEHNEILTAAPDGSLLRRLYQKMKKEKKIYAINQRYSVKSWIKKASIEDPASFFFFIDRNNLLFTLKSISIYLKDYLGLLTPTSYYEIFSIFGLRKNLKQYIKQAIEFR